MALLAYAVILAVTSDSSLPPGVVAALERNATVVDGATVRWTHAIRILDANVPLLGEGGGDLRQDPDALAASASALTFRGGAYRVRETWASRDPASADGSALQRFHGEHAFDGELLTSILPEREGETPFRSFFTVESLERLRAEDPSLPAYRSDLLGAAAIVAPYLIGEHALGPPRSRIVERATRAGATVEFEANGAADGRHHLVRIHDANGESLFELDPDQGCVPVSIRRFGAGGRLSSLTSATEVVEERGGGWFPRRIDVTHFADEAEPRAVAIEEYRVGDLAEAPCDADEFVIAPARPGEMVHDRGIAAESQPKSGFVQWMLPAEPEELDRVLEAARRAGDEAGGGATPRLLREWLGLAAAAIGSACATLVLLQFVANRRRLRAANPGGG